jgi:prepilin-type N-terminal cleavage/methylation domain-containing protein
MQIANDKDRKDITSRTGRTAGGSHGFTIMEIIIAILILVIAVAPMVSAFSPGIFSAVNKEEMAVFSNRARGTLNRVTAIDYKTLSNQRNPVDLPGLFGAETETVSFKGVNYTPTVIITDVSGPTGGLLEISVNLHYVNLKTLKADY